MSIAEPTCGDYFVHVVWLDAEHRPLVCKVTRVARGVVYWRGYYGRSKTDNTESLGSPMTFLLDEAEHYVAHYLVDPDRPPTYPPGPTD